MQQRSTKRSKRGAISCEPVRLGAMKCRQTNRPHGRPKALRVAGLCDSVRRGASRCEFLREWGRWDSNPEPTDYEAPQLSRHLRENASVWRGCSARRSAGSTDRRAGLRIGQDDTGSRAHCGRGFLSQFRIEILVSPHSSLIKFSSCCRQLARYRGLSIWPPDKLCLMGTRGRHSQLPQTKSSRVDQWFRGAPASDPAGDSLLFLQRHV
jgi:hypothetical protein